MKKVVILATLLIGSVYAGVKEDVEKDLYNCSVKKIQGNEFYGKNASDVKITCQICANELYDSYDLEDENAKRDYVKQF